MKAQTLPLPPDPGQKLDGLACQEPMASNASLLRELCLASLGGDGQTLEPAMQLALEANFGGLERWREHFGASARALDGRPGWMLMVFSPSEGALLNQWADDPTHALAVGTPLLALDMCEDACQLDFDTDTAAYVDASLAVINWAGVHARYQAAVHAASETFGVDHVNVADSLVLDVRRSAVYEEARTTLPGAAWRDPATVAQWAAELLRERPVTVYCVHGHEVSRATALKLRALGLDARYLRGGINGWSKNGMAVHPKNPPTSLAT